MFNANRATDIRVLSINTNTGQLVALRYLENAQASLGLAQDQLSTGLKVAAPKDDGAAFAIAQNIRGNLASYQALSEAQDRTMGLLDVTNSAMQGISDLLIQMQGLAARAADLSLSNNDRKAVNDKFIALKNQIDGLAKSASYGGNNLIDSSGSNFLKYGTGALPPGTPAAEWGNPPTSSGEPQAGDPISLHFGFKGGGKQFEYIEGTVSYSMRYWDGSSWTIVPLGQHDIPASPPPQVSVTTPPYDASITTTMPSLPANAQNVQFFAEYNGRYPSPDGSVINDDLVHGGPEANNFGKGTPHLLAGWNEQDWISTPPPPGKYGTGFGIDLHASAPSGQSTQPGQTVSGTLQLNNPDPGLSVAGFDYSVDYQTQDPSNGQWTTTASSGPQSVPAGAVTGANPLSYSLIIPPLNTEGSPASRLVANISVHHDVPPQGQAQTSVQQDSTVTAVGGLTGQPNVSMPNAVTGHQPFSTALIVNTSTIDQNARVDYSYNAQWYDGANWNQANLTSGSFTGLPPATIPASFTLPAISGTVQQFHVTANVQVTSHIPDAQHPADTPVLENHSLTVMNYDASALTTTSVSLAFATAPAVVSQPRETRVLETTTKVAVLNDISGLSRPVRQMDTTTAGLAGLQLDDLDLSTAARAQSALNDIIGAQRRVQQLSVYYANQWKSFSTIQTFNHKLSDTLKMGLGQLVDANMAQVAAQLQASQAKVQLGTQALSIANKFPKALLALFEHN